MKNIFTAAEVRYLATSFANARTAQNTVYDRPGDDEAVRWYLERLAALREAQKLVGLDLMDEKRLEESIQFCHSLLFKQGESVHA